MLSKCLFALAFIVRHTRPFFSISVVCPQRPQYQIFPLFPYRNLRLTNVLREVSKLFFATFDGYSFSASSLRHRNYTAETSPRHCTSLCAIRTSTKVSLRHGTYLSSPFWFFSFLLSTSQLRRLDSCFSWHHFIFSRSLTSSRLSIFLFLLCIFL